MENIVIRKSYISNSKMSVFINCKEYNINSIAIFNKEKIIVQSYDNLFSFNENKNKEEIIIPVKNALVHRTKINFKKDIAFVYSTTLFLSVEDFIITINYEKKGGELIFKIITTQYPFLKFKEVVKDLSVLFNQRKIEEEIRQLIFGLPTTTYSLKLFSEQNSISFQLAKIEEKYNTLKFILKKKEEYTVEDYIKEFVNN